MQKSDEVGFPESTRVKKWENTNKDTDVRYLSCLIKSFNFVGLQTILRALDIMKILRCNFFFLPCYSSVKDMYIKDGC